MFSSWSVWRRLSVHPSPGVTVRASAQGTAAYIKIDDARLRRKIEAILIRFLKSNAVIKTVMVARSHERDTTKGGRAESIPVATELVPFLRVAMAASPSELVFPKLDGTMMRRDVNLEMTLRRALCS